MSNNITYTLTIVRSKGLFKWFKKDKFVLETEYTRLSGKYSEELLSSMLMAGIRPIVKIEE